MKWQGSLARHAVPTRTRVVLAFFLALVLGPGSGATAAVAADTKQKAPQVVKRFKEQANPLLAPALGRGWVGYPARYALVQPKVTLISGKRVGLNGCAFDLATRATTLAPTQEARVRGFNEAACLELVEKGRLPPAEETLALNVVNPAARAALPEVDDSDVPEGATDYVEPGNPVPVPDAGAGVDPDLIAPGTRAAETAVKGYQASKLEDPPNINVTELNTFLWFRYEQGGCVKSRESYATDDWFEQSGWYKVSSNTRGGRDCAHAWSTTFAHYRNQVFCDIIVPGPLPQPTTVSKYDRNVVRGYFLTGVVSGNARHIKSGGCKRLLSFSTRTVKQR